MEGKWNQFYLGELCSLITDGKHGDCRNESGSGYYFLSVKDVLDNRLVYENAREITESDFLETHRRTNLEPGDILFTNTGTIGRMAIVPDDPRTPCTTFQKSVAILKPKRNLVEPYFLYYALKFDSRRLSELAAGTTQKNLLLKDFRSFQIKVPGLDTQRAIAHILGTLDDKIELNRRMNETLEAMARALFKSWFVDFDPVRAKAEGRDPGLPRSLADLFPDRFADSEIGEAPVGWKLGSILEFADLLSGGTPKTSEPDYWNGSIDWVSARDVSEAHGTFLLSTEKRITQAGVDNSSTKLLPAKTVIVTARGTVGAHCLLGRPMAMNQTNYGLKAKDGVGDYFVYFSLKGLVEQLRQQSYGTIFDTVTTKTFQDTLCVQPPERLANRFEAQVSPIMDAILNNQRQSRTLTALRDTLLPKLISGELRVPDAERIIARHT